MARIKQLRILTPFTVDVYFHKFYYIKYTISPTRKSDKNHGNKEDKSEKFHRTLTTRIIKSKEAFLLHWILCPL